jgi:lipopolysaccharide transport system permease protein
MNSDSMENMNRQSWDIVIKPRTGWFDINFAEIWRYRDLILLFVKRDFVAIYKQTILGPLWYLLQPLCTTIVFTIIFGKVAKIPTDSLPPFLFYLAGNVMWGYFAATITATSATFNANAALFGKVYFPRLTVPIAGVLLNFFQFGIQFLLFLGCFAYFSWQGVAMQMTGWILALPVMLLQMALFSLGVGILVSSLTTRYRDLRFVMTFIVQLWMYATPVVYPLSQVPEWIRPYYVLNPMVALVEEFRLAFMGTSTLQWSHVGISWLVTVLVLACGIILFSRIEKTFMDTV